MGVGTDAASPLNMHTEAMWREMSALVDSGMTPIQVISAATKTNAEILDQFDKLGTIEPGKLADIIVIDGNPLATWLSYRGRSCILGLNFKNRLPSYKLTTSTKRRNA